MSSDVTCSPKNALIVLLQNKIVAATRKGCNVLFCSIPSHVESGGNEEVDRAANTCGTRAVDMSSIPFRVYCALTKHHLKAQWQAEWSL